MTQAEPRARQRSTRSAPLARVYGQRSALFLLHPSRVYERVRSGALSMIARRGESLVAVGRCGVGLAPDIFDRGTWLVELAQVFRAFLVEADPGSRGVRDVLALAGCNQIWSAPSCHDAVERIRAERLVPDLLIVDLVELKPSARAMLKRLRDLPVIAIVDEAAVEPALQAGAADVVTRPVRAAELNARISAALQLQAKRARRATRARTLSEEIRRLRGEMHELERLVCVDHLTGIANRRHALSLLQAEWGRSLRDEQPLAVIMIDLDEFHAYNAYYGHPGGDVCLRRAAGAMVGCLHRPSDFLGRYGGEEFVAILANTDAAGVRVVADRMRAAVEALQIPHEASSCAAVVTVSIGFAALQPVAERTAGDLIEAADTALRCAKELGRNCVLGDAPPAPAEAPLDELRWARPSAVTVDPSLVDRIPPFLDAVRGGARSIEEARRVRDFERVRATARKLKAAGRELGFEEVQRLAGMLERAGRAQDREAIRCAGAELDQYAAQVQVVYRRMTTGLTGMVPLRAKTG
jgi:diguanylate cyclase (GGDEF)-like protein